MDEPVEEITFELCIERVFVARVRYLTRGRTEADAKKNLEDAIAGGLIDHWDVCKLFLPPGWQQEDQGYRIVREGGRGIKGSLGTKGTKNGKPED